MDKKEFKFDTYVQVIKYKILRALITKSYEGTLNDSIYFDIPKAISPGPKATMRCCIYKERAIIQERIKIALGRKETALTDPKEREVIKVIDIACDECSAGGVMVTPSCRGCITHMCMETCPKKAISIIEKKAVIDKGLCVDCGKCTTVCPYDAIVIHRRPCVKSCKVGAISVGEDLKVKIDPKKCISCGACVYQCPFGAITDKSFILDAIDILIGSDHGKNYPVVAMLAPAIASQMQYATLGQIVTALKELGFTSVTEAAMGADIVLSKEIEEWQEKGVLTTSCCPSFVEFIQKTMPTLAKHISSSPSPMMEAARLIKRENPNAKVIFIGPCSSKKKEFTAADKADAVDCVLSFEEILAYFDAFKLDLANLPESSLDDASYYGRIFARSGGIAQGIREITAAKGIEGVKPVAMNGLEECKKELTMLRVNRSVYNFFEGMACDGGCLNGALCLHHKRGASEIEKYANQASKKTIDANVERAKNSESEE